MKTFSDYRTGNYAEATSSDEWHHVVTIKDDYGNSKQTIHYRGVTKEFVEKDLAARNNMCPSTHGKF